MTIDDDKDINFSLLQKDTPILHPVSGIPQTKVPLAPRRSKKTRLERLPFSGATSAVMQAIRRVHVECLSEYFEQTCDQRQNDTAVICGPSQLTYQELDHKANRLAHFLISGGVGKGDPIGILLEHSLDTYIALLGVLKAGAAFVPLDPSFPSDQVAFIAKDAGLRGLVTTFTFREKTSALPCPVLELDREHEALAVQPEGRPQVRVDPASLCYIIYTLDATGWPKGVAVSHSNIVNFLRVATPIYRVTRNDRVYQHMSIAFDSSFAEIWPTWIAGATLVAGPANSQRPGHKLTKFLIEYKITVLYCMPTLLATIERDVPSLRSLVIIGETCPADLVNRWSRPGLRMLNTYGPTETTITATWCELFPGRPVTIRSPLPTYHIYILDDQLLPVEEGKSGEICIGGPGITIGYLNRRELTKERFVPNPVSLDREMVPRLYRTGDLGRITPAGEIEYLGRIDAQVKIHGHGYSIERAQIEQVVLPQADPALLDGYASAPQLAARAVSELEAETSRPGMLSRINVKNIYKHIMTDPLYKNSLFNMTSTFILGGLGFIFWIIIARLYRPEYVGIATALISIITLLSSFTVLGLNSGLMRYLPKSVNKNELINSSFVIVTLVSLLTSIVFLLQLQIFSPQLVFLRSNFFYIVSFTTFVVFYAWNILVDSIFMAFRTASNILIKNTIISILKLVLPFALIAFGAYGIFASTALAFTLGVLAGLVILIFKFKIRPSISVNVSLVKETSKYSFANYVAGFMSIMPSLILPVIILDALSAKYAAYYYIASMIQNILQVIPLAVAQALLTEGSYNDAELRKHVKKAFTTLLIVLLPAITVIVLAGNILLQFFGKSYANEAFQFLQLYSASTIFAALLLISNAIMNIKHQIKSLVTLNVLAAVLTLGLSYAFISRKLVGIGWGWILGQAIVGLVATVFILRNLYVIERQKIVC